jgi:hypothetical protein
MPQVARCPISAGCPLAGDRGRFFSPPRGPAESGSIPFRDDGGLSVTPVPEVDGVSVPPSRQASKPLGDWDPLRMHEH